MAKERRVTVIIPTLAEELRFAGLRRAIGSIQQCEKLGELVTICVIVNGSRFDEHVLRWLEEQNLKLVRIAEGSLPLALLNGVRVVGTEYFGFLDDDDEYLSSALSTRVEALDLHPEWDLVVTNGYRCQGGTDTLALSRIRRVSADPLVELFRENWIGSCTGLFRTRSFPDVFFENIPHYLEWSYLGFQIALSGRRVGVIDTPSFRINDTPGSASKSSAYQDAHIDFYRYVLSHNLPRCVTSEVKRRLQDAWALRALYAMHGGQHRLARRSICEVGGLPGWWRYTPLAIRVAARSLKASFF